MNNAVNAAPAPVASPSARAEAEVQQLLAELEAGLHPAAARLREAWLLDCLVRSQLQDTSQPSSPNGLAPMDSQPRSAADAAPEFSAILPIYNEQENIPELYRRLSQVLESLGSFEMVFVNDGSSDGSSAMLRDLRSRDPRVKVVQFSRNFGHQAAVTAGIDFCRGRAVMLLDADLQDPPELLGEMVAKWREGFEVVYAVRRKRRENIAKRASYFLFYRALRALADTDIALDSGDFCLMDRVVVDHLRKLPERNRFLRGLRSWLGFRQIALPYDRDARAAGEPKYTLRKLIKLALDGLVSFSSFPLRVAAYLGVVASLAGFCYLAYALVARLSNNPVPPGWASIIAVMLLLGGTQLIVLGVQGEYIARIYDESKQRPSYIVAEFLA